ncbi:Epoxide hydrolase 4 [Chelonia mydas]|uniref:Epoxide hydrolase 4 n=1 Tax=Chelonia mydas TaxID=8469 RepID=M7B3Q2_CHEMY|nr:Epoxide hydrolase 4 [Chelonia mydas]
MVEKLIIMNAPHLSILQEYVACRLLHSSYILMFRLQRLPELLFSLGDSQQEPHAVQGHAGAHTGDLGGEGCVPGGWDDPLPGAVFAKRCHVGRIPDASHFVSEDQPDKVNQLIWSFLRESD